jgi:ribosomal protein S18
VTLSLESFSLTDLFSSLFSIDQDVLILNQFIEPNGTMMPIEDTKLCGPKYFKVQRLVSDAQKVGLIAKPKHWSSYGPWEQLNSYHEFPKRFRDQPMRIIEPDYWK